MKNLKDIIVERLHINKDTGNHPNHYYNYHPKSNAELKELVDKLIEKRGNNADLNDIDTSEITDMSQLFFKSKFNGNISEWDVSKVEDMSYMFQHSSFNGDISNWDVSNVKNMYYMFAYSEFTCENGDISNWNVRNVKDMNYMFEDTPLEKNPPKWYKN